MTNVVKFDKDEFSVDDMITGLVANREKITGITMAVSWRDGTTTIGHNTKRNADLAFDSVVLSKYVQDLLAEGE